MIDDPNLVEDIVSAATNIASTSLELKDMIGFIAGESTRIMNIYSRLISQDQDYEHYKEIYNKAKDIIIKCNAFDVMVGEIKEPIQALLNKLGE